MSAPATFAEAVAAVYDRTYVRACEDTGSHQTAHDAALAAVAKGWAAADHLACQSWSSIEERITAFTEASR